MGKCIRYLLLTALPNYAATTLSAGALLLLCYLSKVPATGDGLFAMYFQMYPFVLLFIALFSGVSLTTLTLSTALSYGARRRDYFNAMLVMILLNTLFFWLSDCVLSLLPHLLGWPSADALCGVIVSWTLPFLLLLCFCGGCALGELVYRHRIIAGLLGGVMGSCVTMVIAFSRIMESNAVLWGSLPWLIPVVCLVLSILCLLRVRTKTRTAVVTL